MTVLQVVAFMWPQEVTRKKISKDFQSLKSSIPAYFSSQQPSLGLEICTVPQEIFILPYYCYYSFNYLIAFLPENLYLVSICVNTQEAPSLLPFNFTFAIADVHHKPCPLNYSYLFSLKDALIVFPVGLQRHFQRGTAHRTPCCSS